MAPMNAFFVQLKAINFSTQIMQLLLILLFGVTHRFFGHRITVLRVDERRNFFPFVFHEVLKNFQAQIYFFFAV